MSTLFNVKKTTVNDMISNSNEKFIVKSGGKTYAWDQKHWNTLYNDITNLSASQVHFIGSIVIKLENGNKSDIKNYEILDGGQRIITLIILLAVLRDKMTINNKYLANHIDNTFLHSKNSIHGQEIYTPKLTLGDFDNHAFKCILERKHQHGNHPLFGCYNFFLTKNTDEYMWIKILNNVSFILINSFSEFDLFSFFETLNDQGNELSSITLIKNFFMMKFLDKPKTFNEASNIWHEMIEKTKDKEPEEFFRDFFFTIFKRKIPSSKLYNYIRKDFTSKNSIQILEIIIDMNEKASIYKRIIERSFNSERINNYLTTFTTIGVSINYPILLDLLYYYNISLVSEEEILFFFKMIETFNIRWRIITPKNTSLNRIYKEIYAIISLYQPNKIISMINEFLSAEIDKNLDNYNFRKSFIDKSHDSSNKGTKYILWKLSNPSGVTLINFKAIQTEHIMPKKLNSFWEKYLTRLLPQNRNIHQEHKEFVNIIGNLTILKDIMNRYLSQKMFSDKKRFYQRSELTITKEISGFEKWDFDEIRARTNILADRALRIWKWQKIKRLKFI